MSSSPRELVQAMIRRRVSRSEKLKAERASDMDPRSRIMRFLSEFDEALRACATDVEKYWLIESEPSKLLADLQRIDSGCEIELVWFGDEMSDMRLEGVRVTWSPDYSARSGREQEELVDLASILFG